MKKIKILLFTGFICAPLLSYASIPSEIKNNKMNMAADVSIEDYFKEISLEENIPFFKLDPQTAQAVKETAFLMRKGLEDLGAGAIRGIFILPGKGSLSSERASVAFVGTAGECFIYDSATRETMVCGEAEKVLVRSSKELLSSSLGFVPIDTLLSQGRALQVAGLGDWICSHQAEILMTIGAVMMVSAASLILVGITGVVTFASAIEIKILAGGLAGLLALQGANVLCAPKG